MNGARALTELPQAWVEDAAPGAWLRVVAVGATASTGLVVASGALDLGFTHNALVAPALATLVALEISAVLAHRWLLRAVSAALFLLLLEIALGGVVALAHDARWAVGLHLAVAVLAFGATVLATASVFRGADAASAEPVAWRDYVALTKPRVMTLLLLTGGCSTVVAAGGSPTAAALVGGLAGLALACGGASAMNHVLDRDIDRLMGERTQTRPVASGRVAPSRALDFGLALVAASFVLLAGVVNLATALLALAGAVFYVVVYTGWLKRTTWHNTAAGGVAGAIPALVGAAAATGRVGTIGAVLFLIIFVWQPPHFWALSLLIKEHYANAGIPMLPVVRGIRETTRHMVWWTAALVPVTFLPVFLHELSWIYLAAAAVLDLVFAALVLAVRTSPDRRRAAICFHFSLLYLALLFVAAAVDAVVL